MKSPLMLFTAIVCSIGLYACEGSGSSAKKSSSSVGNKPSSSSSTYSSASSSVSNTTHLVINEVVVKSENNDFLNGNDWIEIYNGGNTRVELSDYWISDSASERFMLPAVQLNPGDYFVLAAVDVDDPAPPTPSVPFKLGDEDGVQIFKDDQLVTALYWVNGQIPKGAGFGLVGDVLKSTVPTPASVNVAAPIGSAPTGNSDLIISEVVAKSADQTFLAGNDWIELYNAGSSVISLSAYKLADSASQPIALSGQLNPGQYRVIAAVDADDLNPPSPSVPFKLGSDDSVLLFLGDQLVDALHWTASDVTEGKGFGVVTGVRQPTEPTPNQSNKAAPSQVNPTPQQGDLIINEIVAKSDNSNYLAGNDWIELFNSGTGAIELSDYYLSDSASERVRLAAGKLNPGEYKVIAAVDADDTNPPTPSVPFKLGSEDVVFLYYGESLVGAVLWGDGDVPLGRGLGLIDGNMQSTTPTPGSSNRR